MSITNCRAVCGALAWGFALICALGLRTASAAGLDLATALNRLPTASFEDKSAIIEGLAQSRPKGARPLLQAMFDDHVAFRESDKKVFIVSDGPGGYALTDPLTGKASGTASSDDFDSVGMNNHLRKELRVALAEFDLSSKDPVVRRAAVSEVLHSINDTTQLMLRSQLALEPDSSVRRLIKEGLALGDLDDTLPVPRRLAAIQALSGSLNPDVYNRLATLADPVADADPAVRGAAARAMTHIQSWRSFYDAIETLFFGFSLGSVLVLSAIGLAITFGVMGVINMAHGELMMLGAYTVYVMQLILPGDPGVSTVLAVPAAFVVCGAVGVLIERSVVRFLYGRPLETLLATFGVSLILQQLARDVFTANNRPVESPTWMSGLWQINGALSITYNRLVIVLFTLVVFGALLMVMKRTRLGLEVRAVAQNRAMARAMGIRSQWVDAMTFGLGSGIAGIAGVALSQLTNVGPNLGQSYIVDSFMVVVFGGVGNLWGTMIGGMSLGIINKILEPYAGAVLGKIIVLVALILFIQRRPRGIFPQKGRAAEA
ncbi:MAG TPA: urea ABC transporter permease subunit UrtB [Steroidobacteraceae bacterium]|jgi:urea transport system permease protein|nr:urea ABC transporter permease subunit UrtB [Steroidobacteraceae bacterium]